jgi:hypothetical protein
VSDRRTTERRVLPPKYVYRNTRYSWEQSATWKRGFWSEKHNCEVDDRRAEGPPFSEALVPEVPEWVHAACAKYGDVQ